MTASDVRKWYKRMSVVYAAGIWTMLCSYGFFRYICRNEDTPKQSEKKDARKVQESPNQVVYETPYGRYICIYKEGFVPYRIRIMNFVKSFSTEPGSGDDGGK